VAYYSVIPHPKLLYLPKVNLWSSGRAYILPVMFFSTPDLRAPSADRRETSPHDGKLAEFYNPTPKIRGLPPPKMGGGQNMQNSVDFVNFRLWSCISPERIYISKIGEKLVQPQPLPRWAKKTWWTLVHKQQRSSDAYWPNKMNFFRETIVRPLRGAAPSNFYTC